MAVKNRYSPTLLCPRAVRQESRGRWKNRSEKGGVVGNRSPRRQSIRSRLKELSGLRQKFSEAGRLQPLDSHPAEQRQRRRVGGDERIRCHGGGDRVYHFVRIFDPQRPFPAALRAGKRQRRAHPHPDALKREQRSGALAPALRTEAHALGERRGRLGRVTRKILVESIGVGRWAEARSAFGKIFGEPRDEFFPLASHLLERFAEIVV